MKPRNLEVRCPEQLTEALVFAINRGCVDALTSQLDYLAGYCEGGRSVLMPDRAPLSFGFEIYRADGSFWMAGGLMYSGPMPCASEPSFSVDINGPSAVPRWEVHT